jgi:hypothetical protein
MLTEERRKPSVFVGEPEVKREMPSFFTGMCNERFVDVVSVMGLVKDRR